MSEKKIYSRMVQKHDIETNWNKAVNFIPLQGEIIIYDIDENYNYERFKIGDGINTVSTLPFVSIDLGKDNSIISPDSLAGGKHSVAGLKGYYIKAINFKRRQILLDTETTEWTDKNAPSIVTDDNNFTPTSNEDIPYKVGNYIGIINGNHYVFLTTIKAVNKNVITYEGGERALGFSSFVSNTKKETYLFFVPQQPEIGIVTLEDGGALSFGLNAISNGNSTAIGRETLAYLYGTALGRNTIANFAALSEGQNTKALGRWSHSAGLDTEARADISYVEGEGTIASSKHQHVQGKFNIVDDQGKYAHIVGNGTSSARSNAHTIDWDGNAWFAGKIYNDSEITGYEPFTAAPYRIINHDVDGIAFFYENASDYPGHNPGEEIVISLNGVDYICTISHVWDDRSSNLGHFTDTVTNTSVEGKYGFRIYVTDENKALLPDNMNLYQGYALKNKTSFSYIIQKQFLRTKGVKFVVDTPTEDDQVVNKAYVDTKSSLIGTKKDEQIIVGINTTLTDSNADIILNGPNNNLLSLSENAGAYTIDTSYHEFTYPIADCRYFPYDGATGPVFVADMTRTSEIPHLLQGQKIILTINGVEYSSTLGTVWALNELGNFTQDDIFGNARSALKAAGFFIKENNKFGPIYTALNALGSIDNIINNVTFKVEDTSLNLASLRPEEKAKTVNAITLGKNPSISSGTIFAIGNAAHLADNYEHNAFEVKNNGDVIIEGDILNPDGTSKFDNINTDVPTKLSELEQDLTELNIGNLILAPGRIDGREGMSIYADVISMSASTSSFGVEIHDVVTPVANRDAANKKYVDDSIANIVNSAPETLNTLNELASALGNDENFATTVATQIGELEAKVDSVPTKMSELEQDLTEFNVTSSNSIELLSLSGTGTYSNAKLAAYLTSINGGSVNISGSSSVTISGDNLSSTGNVHIHDLVDPTNETDAVNKKYVDNQIAILMEKIEELKNLI